MGNHPQILAACPPFALPRLQAALEAHVRLVPATSMEEAQKTLQANPDIVLIVCGVHFDESRMFELLDYARRGFPQVPFVCVRVLDAEIPRISRHALDIAAQSMGATAYLDLPQLQAEVGREAAERRLREVVLEQLGASRIERAR